MKPVSKENRFQIPYITLIANFLVGTLSFLPFPGWQKLVAFLSSASILSYSIGPICLLALRKLQPDMPRPFKLGGGFICAHIAFCVCNLMLYWCGFEILWKLNVALITGLIIYLIYQRKNLFTCGITLAWFIFYMVSLLVISFLGSFGGIGTLTFPLDFLGVLLLSIVVLCLSH